MRLLLVKNEEAKIEGFPYTPDRDHCLVIVPDGYNGEDALKETILPYPHPYVVAEFAIVADDPPDLKKLELHCSYTSYSEND